MRRPSVSSSTNRRLMPSARADLGGRPLDVKAPPDERHHHAGQVEIVEVGTDRLFDSGVLDLDGHGASVTG